MRFGNSELSGKRKAEMGNPTRCVVIGYTLSVRFASPREGGKSSAGCITIRVEVPGCLDASAVVQSRYHQKGLFYRLPGRPILKFAYMMLLRRAFLDGRPGITYAMLQSIYEYFIVLKQAELAQAKLARKAEG